MGMFDTVRSAYPLPHHQDSEFQTKDLAFLVEGEMMGGFLDDYEITAEGRLRVHRHEREWVEDPDAFFRGYLKSVNDWWEDVPDVHGDIRMYTTDRQADGTSEWTEFKIRFTHGVVESVTELDVPAFGSS